MHTFLSSEVIFDLFWFVNKTVAKLPVIPWGNEFYMKKIFCQKIHKHKFGKSGEKQEVSTFLNMLNAHRILRKCIIHG